MRNSVFTLAAIFTLTFSTSLLGEAVDMVGSGHGASCAEAKANLAALIQSGPDSYTAEQAQTRQFPTGPAAVAFCQSRGASAPYAELPEIGAAEYFPLPTEIYEVANAPCSFSYENGMKVYGVGWSGSSACNL